MHFTALIMDNIINIGNSIAKRRKFLKLTQPQLAELAGISLRSLKSIESGEGNPTLTQIMKILNILGMKLDIIVR